MRVAEHLDLDVPGLLDELLDEHAIVAEGGFGLVAAAVVALARLGIVARDAQTLAATTGARLDHHGIADLPGDRHRPVAAFDHVGVAGDRVDLRLSREPLRRDLVSHHLDRARLRSDEHDAVLLKQRTERGVLGQEAVAGMDRFGAGIAACLQDPLHHEVALARGWQADRHRLVGQVDVA